MGLDSFLLLAQTNVLDVLARKKKLTQAMIPVVAGIAINRDKKTKTTLVLHLKNFLSSLDRKQYLRDDY